VASHKVVEPPIYIIIVQIDAAKSPSTHHIEKTQY